MKARKPADSLQSELIRQLESKRLDYDRILEIAAKLAASDPDYVRFTADAGLIDRLGKELVARQETAVSELVKNSYDADSTKTELIFRRAQAPGGKLTIIDNGNGMNREQLIAGFMRLASSEKVSTPLSPIFVRRRAGRKGIGRFATQRLGTKLELVTQTLESKKALKVSIDWEEFGQTKNLFGIKNRIEEIKKERPKGTTLTIRSLRDGWTDKQISRIYRYVEDLLQPFPLSKIKKTKRGKAKDPGFKVSFFRQKGAKRVAVASDEKMVHDFALATVSASVDENGRGIWNVTSERHDLNEGERIGPSEDKKAHFNKLRNVHLKASYFVWSPDLIPPQQFSRLRKLAEEQGGIRLYRNGFRALPYGEPGDDWLKLDQEARRRSMLFPLSNLNWLGFVEVTDLEGTEFEETSSREGLANNDAFIELQHFAFGALTAAAGRVAAARNIKLTAGQKDFTSKILRNPPISLSDAAGKLQAAAEQLIGSNEGMANATVRAAAETARQAASEARLVMEENAMLRVLSSLGLTIGIFTHEVRHQLLDLKNLVRDWLEKYGGAKAGKAVLPTLEAKIKLLKSYVAYFDHAVAANVRRELEPQNVTEILFSFIDQFDAVIKRDGAEFTEPEISEDLVSRPMHSSEWASILGNLLTNSLKAIRRGQNSDHGRIFIKAYRDKGEIIVEFVDNGDGIPKENRGRVFDAFFTTTSSASDAGDELIGTGLGLKIVSDILSAAGGSIEVATPPREYATCIKLRIPSAKESS
jgi:signal transduction histidine kinase